MNRPKSAKFSWIIIIAVVLIALWGIAAIIGFDDLYRQGKKLLTGHKEQSLSNIMEFVPYSYFDDAAGMEAFSMLLPKGWKSDGSISWSANPAMPAKGSFRFWNPAGNEEFTLFPGNDYFWTDNQLFLTTNPPGTLRFGTLVAQPVDLSTAFNEMIIPGFRKNIKGLKMIESTDVPELADLAKGPPVQGVTATAEGGKLRIEYTENGILMEEEIYASVSQFVTYMPGSYFSTGYFINYWFVDNVFSFRAEKGKLDAQTKLFQTMLYSLKVNKSWFAKVANVKEQLAQMIIQNIHAVGRMGEIIANAGSQMREEQMQAWEYRQQVNDKIAQNFGDYILGIDRYNDPYSGNEIELPSGYGIAWSNNLGEVIMTDNPNFNPNVGSNLGWQKMDPVK